MSQPSEQKSSTTKSSDPTDQDHHRYWPTGLTPITPQARRRGVAYPTYITDALWKRAVSWTGPSRFKTNVDKRIFELIDSMIKGMDKRMAGSDDEDGFLFFKFKHWFYERGKPNAKKKASMKCGCRLFINPDTNEPWILVFDPEYDYATQLKKQDLEELKDDQHELTTEEPTDFLALAVGETPASD